MGYAISLILGTFVLEDAALLAGIALVAQGKLTFAGAFFALFVGISLGDLGLFAVGKVAAFFGWQKRVAFLRRHEAKFAQLQTSQVMTYAILVSRLIPGTRLVTYVGAGLLNFSMLRFLWLTLVSVFLWVLLVMAGGEGVQYLFGSHLYSSLAILFLVLLILKKRIPQLLHPWRRKTMLYSWRKWLHFEFWPGTLFYLPVVPYYIFLGLKYRSLYMPFYLSPHLPNGGLIGESKWDFLQFLNQNDPTTLPAIRIDHSIEPAAFNEALRAKGISFPLIMKPDVGQRGFGVRIVRNQAEANQYLQNADFQIVVQALSQFKKEAGLFYIREPQSSEGFLFSITDKMFPFVTGDGKTKLGDLILKDPRARIISEVYFARLESKFGANSSSANLSHADLNDLNSRGANSTNLSPLDTVPAPNEVVPLSECGNHCQGAIFLNGQDLSSKELTQEIDRIAKQIPDFYFGRFDIRYQDAASLKNGQNFEIVEINGAGSEATHIWDARTSLSQAYATLFQQWRYAFSIGATLRKRAQTDSGEGKISGKGLIKNPAWTFVKECVRVHLLRKPDLSISS